MGDSAKCLTLDLGSGQDLAVRLVRSSPESGSALITRGLLEILSLSLCPSPAGARSLSPSLSVSKLKAKHLLKRLNAISWAQ